MSGRDGKVVRMREGRTTFEVELREDAGELRGVVITEGRAATGGRRELFILGSLKWDATGIGIRTGHGEPVEVRAHPTRGQTGEISIRTQATDAIRRAVEAGKRWLSIEFVATREKKTAGGVREVLEAFLRDAALTDRPEYGDGLTFAEVREERRPRVWL